MAAAAPARARRPGSSSSRPPRWVWYAAAAAAGLVVVLYIRSRRSSAQAQVLPTTGPDMSTSGAQLPSGGAGGIPSNLPPSGIVEPDATQVAVQTTDTTNPESPQAIAAPNAPTYAQNSGVAIWGAPTPAPSVNTAGVVAPGGVPALVDASGHVVNAAGFRVGGAADISS